MTSPDPNDDTTSSKYNVQIGEGQGIVIGDHPQVVQHFYGTPPEVQMIRPQTIADEIPISSIIWNIPYRRNPFFTGREDVLKNLHQILTADKTAALTQAISGLGGIGKTQTAVEYAYRYRNDYQAVFWVRAETQEMLISDFVSIADLLELPEKKEQDQNLIFSAVKRWLQSHTDWLLILDNVEDLEMVSEFMPSVDKGHILLTTRTAFTGIIAYSIELDKMETEEGALFLLRRAKIIAPGTLFDNASAADQVHAKEISQAMDGLPLALDQAGAYIEEIDCGLVEYLTLYRGRQAVLLNRRGRLSANHAESVATTWSLSFEKVEQANPGAADLLRLCAFLHPDAIPEEIIIAGAPNLGPTLQPVASDPIELNEAINELRRFSLVKRDPDLKLLNIHRLMQAVIKDRMNEVTQRQWAERAVLAVNHAFPDVDFAVWQHCQRCLSQAQACSRLIEQWALVLPEAARLLDQLGSYLQERAQYAEAKPFLLRALELRKQVLGPEHPDVATSLNNLGLLYYNQGMYAQTEPLYLQGLAIREQVLGSEDPKVAMSLYNLQDLYRDQDNYEQAELLCQRAIAIWKKTLGSEHFHVAEGLNSLGLLYHIQGKYTQAEPLYLQALAIWKKVLGLEHRDVATCLNNLAGLYDNQGKYTQAEPLYLQALAIQELMLGPEHPQVATILGNLAMLYYAWGKYTQAELPFLRALKIREQVLGPEHPDTAISLNTLAMLYYAQGKYIQAEPRFLRALAIWEQTLGTEGVHVINPLNNLTKLYADQGKYAQAEPFGLRALAICKQLLEPENPHVAQSLNSLAVLYRFQSRYIEAEPLFQRALTIREKSLGSEHPYLAQTLHDLAWLYYHEGKSAKAEPLFQRALTIRKKVLAPEHPDIAQTLHGLARLYHTQDEYLKAEPLYKRALHIYERALLPEHPDVINILENYAELLRGTNREAEAAELEKLAQAIRAKHAKENSPSE